MKSKSILLVPCMLFSMVMTAAAEGPVAADQKNECLLYSQNCANQAMTIQEKIRALQTEINKGTRVYTPAELQRLSGKLKDAEDTLNDLLYGPAAGAISGGHGGHR